MKKVLVIGASSYIGQKFKEYVLLNNQEDISVDMTSASDGAWRKVDFSRYDAILHLSAIVHRKEKKSMESLYFEINHKMAVEVAQKAKESHVKQFIFMSTAAVYGTYTGCITKDTIPNPTTYYGKSKLAAENDIIKLQDDKFKVAIVRPPMVYGEGCKGNYARLEKVVKYTPFFIKYHNKRSMVHILKLSRYLVDLIINESSGHFHPQDNEYIETSEFVKKIRKDMGKKTILLNGFDSVLRILIHKIAILKKIFGDLYYEEEDI